MLKFPPDITFLIQIVSFLALWFGLKRLLFDPMVRLLEERDARTSGAQAEAQRIRAGVEVSGAEYERRLHEVRQALLVEAEAARKVAAAEEQNILGEARAEASSTLALLRDDLNRQADAARPALAAEARQLASSMVERVAGRALA